MNNRIIWHRSGDFYQALQYRGPLTNIVRFINTAEHAVYIREITVSLRSDTGANIRLKASPFLYKDLENACKDLFGKDEISSTWLPLDVVSIPLNEANLKKIMSVLYQLNAQNDLSIILIFDLIQIVNALKSPLSASFYTKKHYIKERSVSNAHTNPARKQSLKLVKFLSHTDYSDQHEKELKKLLVAGEDPNQQKGLGSTPLYEVVASSKFHRTSIFLLLCYGANPWKARHSFDGLCVIEFARAFKRKDEYEFIMNTYCQVERRNQNSKIVKLNHAQFRPKSNSIITHFEFSNSLFITSEFKSVQNLSSNEIKQLFNVYSRCYSSKENINDAFIKAFSFEQGKMIDILRNKEHQIIGAVVSVVRKSKNDIHVFINDSILHPDYQGCGLMPLIDYRLPFALKLIYPECNVSILFFAASYNAIRRIEKTLYFPKYQPDGMKERVKDIYAKVFQYSVEWHDADDGVFFTITEKNQVTVNVSRKPLTTLLEEFYYQQLNSKNKGYVPVLILPEEDLLSTLHDILSPRDINFYGQYKQFAALLRNSNILSDRPSTFSQNEKSIVMNSAHLFYTGKNVAVNEERMMKYAEPEMRTSIFSKY